MVQVVEELVRIANSGRGDALLEQEAHVVLANLELLRERLVLDLKLDVIPRDVHVATQVLARVEAAKLSLESLAELLARLVVPDEVWTGVVLLDLVVKHKPVAGIGDFILLAHKYIQGL